MEKIALILIISILGYLLITNVMVKYLRMKKEKNRYEDPLFEFEEW